MELLVDTDFIVKMGRYGLLDAFEDLMQANGHAVPLRCLREARGMLDGTARNAAQSKFRSQVAWNRANSFVQGCRTLDPAVDIDMLDELDGIVGIDAGEALLVEYAMRNPDAVIVTGDKKFIDGLATPAAKRFREGLKGRVFHMEHAVFALATAKKPPLADIRQAVDGVPDCDTALHGILHPGKGHAQAEADLFASTKNLNQRGLGMMPAQLCPPYANQAPPPVQQPPPPPV